MSFRDSVNIALSVQSWDPAASELTSKHRDILQLAVEQLSNDGLQVSEEDQSLLRPVMQLEAPIWRRFVAAEASDTIIGWIKILTLVERDLSGFESGPKSPVLALLKELKERQAVPGDLIGWVRSHTNNRFLPYGSLADRL